MPFWIAVTFEHVDDLEPVVPIAEEDHIIAERRTADVRAKFGARMSECRGQRSKLETFSARLVTKVRATGRLPLSRVT